MLTILCHSLLGRNLRNPSVSTREFANATAYLICDPIAKESNVPKTQTHVPVESDVYSPSHPADVLKLLVDPEPQACKRDLTGSREMVKIAGCALRSVTGRPFPVGLVGTRREATEGSILVRFQELVHGREDLVIVYDLVDMK